MEILLEVCCGDTDSVSSAISGGAGRIELCCSLESGGLTPSAGLIGEAIWKSRRMLTPIPVNVLIRPRSGDFFYNDKELRQCVQDTAYAVGAGADGIVFGALTPDGEVDTVACRMILDAIAQVVSPGQHVSTTFHRAFDMCRDPFAALEDIIRLGFDRILTSGQAPSAEAGLDLLRDLNNRAAGRISIMPGAGVNKNNIMRIAEETGALEIHASAKEPIGSRMRFRRDGIGMGTRDDDEYSRFATSASLVKELIESLKLN